MREIEARFDPKRHMLYSKAVKRIVRKDIEKRCHGSEALIWKKTRDRWSEYVDDLPYIGGKKNRQAGSVYDAVLFFAYYSVLPKKMSRDEFEDLCNELCVPVYEKLTFADFNKPIVQKIGQFAFSFLGKIANRHKDEWVGNYTWDVEDFDPEVGVRFRYHTCPIADFAKSHGFQNLMSAMCNGDFPMLHCVKCQLIRMKTCGSDECCDYWLVGDRSRFAEEHPEYRDEMGYIRNR